MSSFSDNVPPPLCCSNSNYHWNLSEHRDVWVNTTNLTESQPNCNLCNKCCATTLPFANVADLEFLLLYGVAPTSDSVIDKAEYFTPTQLSNLTRKNNKSDFFMLHLNTSSLPKNHDKIEELLNEFETGPEIISISETKLNSRCTSNFDIFGYDFLHNDSPTKAGGVGLYINKSLKYKLRNDLNLLLPNCEDLWIEIKSKKRNIILSTIYRHPNLDVISFQNKLCETLTKLEGDKLHYIINGDYYTLYNKWN